VNRPTYSPEKNTQQLANRIEELRNALKQTDPVLLASTTGMTYKVDEGGRGEFHTALFDRQVVISYPEFEVCDLPARRVVNIAQQALILYYCQTTNGSPTGEDWISFTELPNGRYYTQAFQGYSGDELGRIIADDREGFCSTALKVGGIQQAFGDIAFAFLLLPLVSLMVVYWQGDEDFPSRYQVLFSSNVSHHLPTDACAIAGSMLTRRLISTYKSPN